MSPRKRNLARFLFPLIICCGSLSSILAADPSSPASAAEREKALLKEVKIPPGFDATIFAAAPEVNYPVFIAAAPDGVVYVSSDKNGSLDRAPGRGRILRARDLDGDGRADEVKLFVPNVDSPRGLVWDHDRLYLLHPPHLSAFIDRDGDGVADEEKVLVKNIAFGFQDRPADHTSNGIELGIDGWIYCAIGDFGFMQAEGADGRKLQLRGGGVVRVRPDGTGLELYSRGTRNILEVAVSPLLDLFARDNTNDGGGWDIRFHHFTGLSEHGYPSLFKNFPGEFIEPLADYGGGSGCGALFLSEPGFPAGYNDCVYTADWGREWIYRHAITAKGATFTVDQQEFLRAPRVTDLDVDGLSRLYVSSWKGATFTYAGENVGFLVRLTPKGYVPEPLPDFGRASETELLKLLESASHRRRLEAQRALLRRGLSATVAGKLGELAGSPKLPLASRVAAVFALKQGLQSRSSPALGKLAGDSSIREYAIRALADRLEEASAAPLAPVVSGLADASPRIRRESAFALARLDQRDAAVRLAPLLGDADPVVAHTAMQALKALDAANVCFTIIDNPESFTPQRTRALQVLQSLHQPEVVDGLIRRVEIENDPERRHGILSALCRLHFKAGEWKGDSWGTRPDTSGPYYQPAPWDQTPKIAGVLKARLAAKEDSAFLVTELTRHKIYSDETLATVVSMAAADSKLVPSALAQLARADRVPSAALPLLTSAATASGSSAAARANAIKALAKVDGAEAIQAMLGGLTQLKNEEATLPEFQLARDAFLNSTAAAGQPDLLAEEAAKLDPARSPWADAALLKLAARANASPEARAAAQSALDKGWENPRRRAQLLQAALLAEHRVWREKILEAVNDPDAAVAGAAREAVRRLRLDRPRGGQAGGAGGPLIQTLTVPDAVAAVGKARGDVKTGEEVFKRQGCVNCHTVSAEEPLKGPFLGNIATIYKRAELAESILLPNKTIAQGFITHQFELKDGTELEGFVIQEAADKVTIRNVTAQEIQIRVADILHRSKVEKSLMPDGLAATLTVSEFASLLDYLEGLSKK